MAFNELEAIKMIDEGKITDTEIKLLTRVRDGLAKEDVVKDKAYDTLIEKGLVMDIDLSHPRASVHVPAVVATETGTTVLNLFDKRYRENTSAGPAENTAPNTDPKLVKHPTEEEARKVPSIATKPLPEKDKQLDAPKLSKAAKNDETFKTGGKDLSDVKEEKEIPLKDVKIVEKK